MASERSNSPRADTGDQPRPSDPLQGTGKRQSKRAKPREHAQESKRSKLSPQHAENTPEIPDWFKPFQTTLLGISSSLEKLSTIQLAHQSTTSDKTTIATPVTSALPDPIQLEPEGYTSDEENPVFSDSESTDPVSHSAGPSHRSQVEAVNVLLTDMFKTLGIQEEVKEQKTLDKLFSSPQRQQRHFPVHNTVEELIKKEWKTPDRRLAKDKRVDTLYPFAQTHKDLWDNIPKVDAPVARLAKRTTIPLEDGTSFRDPMDRKAESLLKNIFASSTSAFKPTISSACISSTVVLWLEEALTAVTDESFDMHGQLSKILNAVHFLCDSSMDTLQLLAKTSAMSIGARRALWMKTWSADPASKKNLVALPFTGASLFGPELDSLISKITGGKSNFLPQDKKPRPSGSQPKRPFRSTSYTGRFSQNSRPQNSYSGPTKSYRPNKKPSWNTHRRPFKGTPDKPQDA
uniref:Lamina-associated polypeptide 2 alpha C-terminal domain-containing protein n=1 Tax=Xenopus tropicalis TaxID=8364 RepID=A0A803JXE6_XENTR